MQQQKINLSPEQMQAAANAGVQLLNTPGAVNVPGPMAVSGIIATLNSLLTAIATQQAMVIQVPPKPVEEPPPGGDGEKKPDLTPVEGGKKAEK